MIDPPIAFASSISLNSLGIFWIAIGIVAAAAAILAFRKRLKSIPCFLLLFGAALLAVASGLPTLSWRFAGSVVVRVDLSPSTRTAAYRDRDYLSHRIARLLGDTPFRIEYFAGGLVEPAPNGPSLADAPCDQTTYPAPDSVTLLFSDCQFDLPARAPATYIALDSALEEAVDGAVTGIGYTNGRSRVATRVVGPGRTLSITGGAPATQLAAAGRITHEQDIAPSTTTITAQLNPGDAWPENDALSLTIAKPLSNEKWWIGNSAAAPGWRQLAPGDLPLAAEDYLAPSLIALSNVRAGELDATHQQRLTQYVKALGGSLLILGGDHAFGAGDYYGTPLNVLSPLASNPPTPVMQWIILVDASGSMSSPAAGSTRWGLATSAAINLLPRIPANDSVSIGGFSDAISWWAQSQPAGDVAAMTLPPAQAVPHGPTNLRPAIQNVIDGLPTNVPTRMLIISDFDASLSDAGALATSLRAKQIHVDLLAIGQGSALPAMRQVSTQTGGNTLVSADPAQWAQSARDLLSAALPGRFETEPISVVFTEGSIGSTEVVSAWNRVWAKTGASIVAEGKLGDATVPLSAEWNLGEGRVLAVGFTPAAHTLDQIAKRLAAEPRDPRISVSHEAGRDLVVSVRAFDNDAFLNDLPATIELRNASESNAPQTSYPIPQTAPGQYMLRLPAPRSMQFANVVANHRSVERFPVAGRYAPEFESIGNNRGAMAQLAQRTGGAVILPTQLTPIDIKWPTQRASATAPLAMAGTAVIGVALMWMRQRGAV